ncbi:MAG: AbrB/MazE/SpoVT family DNA-binding domain-containing protein [Nitrospirae bacterium]|nr:AbrB/MazE/SpoVT family DNA-binding domain-containing protein [Nitrospirota bacterium]
MLTKTLKWGNSLAVRIPKVIGTECGIEENSSVEISLRDKQIIIMPVKKEYSLKELLAGVTKDNIHSEFDTGRPVGKEAL